MDAEPARGHQRVPHTADLRVRSWAPTREECLAEAVTGVVTSFADTGTATPSGTVEFDVPAGADEDLLVGLLDEMVFRLDSEGTLPVGTEVTVGDDGGLRVRWRTVGTGAVELVGAVPKAVSLHGLEVHRDTTGWTATVTMDV